MPDWLRSVKPGARSPICTLLFTGRACSSCLLMVYPLCTALYSWYWDQTSSVIRMRHSIVECSCVNHHIFSIEGESEAIQAPWSRAVQEFTTNVIVRTMTAAFDTHAVIAERYSTTHVNTPMIQRNTVRAITIYDDRLRVQLDHKRSLLQYELC